MKKTATIILVLMLAISAVFAGGADETSNAKTVTITYATGDPTTKEAVHEVVQAFNKSQDKWVLQENLSVSTGAYLDSLKTLNASGQMPDIFECRDTPVFVRADMLEPLDQEILDLFEVTIPVYGTVYTAPMIGAYPHFMLYNKAYFEKHGINQHPETYADFLQICEDLKATGISPIAAGVADIWHIGFLFNYYMTQYASFGDPNYVAKLYTGENKFDTPEMTKAMTMLSDLFRSGNVDKGFMSTTESFLTSLLVSEKCAMIYTGSWTISAVEEADPDFEIGFFNIPDEDGNVIIHGGASSQAWAITKQAAEDPEKKECFNEFIKFFFSEEQYAPFLAKTNAFQTTVNKVEYEASPLMEEILAEYNKYPKCLAWNEGVGENELPPTFRNWTYKKVQEMLMGLLEPEQLVKDMDEEWARVTRDFNPTIKVSEAL